MRDSFVLVIWEGTTNVLANDFWRVMLSDKAKDALYTEFGIQAKIPQEENMCFEMFKIAKVLCNKLIKRNPHPMSTKLADAWENGVYDRNLDIFLLEDQAKL